MNMAYLHNFVQALKLALLASLWVWAGSSAAEPAINQLSPAYVLAPSQWQSVTSLGYADSRVAWESRSVYSGFGGSTSWSDKGHWDGQNLALTQIVGRGLPGDVELRVSGGYSENLRDGSSHTSNPNLSLTKTWRVQPDFQLAGSLSYRPETSWNDYTPEAFRVGLDGVFINQNGWVVSTGLSASHVASSDAWLGTSDSVSIAAKAFKEYGDYSLGLMASLFRSEGNKEANDMVGVVLTQKPAVGGSVAVQLGYRYSKDVSLAAMYGYGQSREVMKWNSASGYGWQEMNGYSNSLTVSAQVLF